MEKLSINLYGDFTLSHLGNVLNTSLLKVLGNSQSRLPEWIIKMSGMSGIKYRKLINHIVENTTEPVYLEVGSWLGSTACSALFGNTVDATCIDNWSQFQGPKEQFLNNINSIKNDKINFNFIESDFRKVKWSDLKPVNVYLFDGPHTEQDQYDGVVMAQSSLQSSYLLIVDDYNWLAVREGTQKALKYLNSEIECSIEIRTTQDDSYPNKNVKENSDWHNGYYLAVVNKRF